MTRQFEYDTEVHAVYITLREAAYIRGYDLDSDRHVDFGADGTPIGIELLDVHLGVDVAGLPDADSVTAVLREHGIQVLAPARASVR